MFKTHKQELQDFYIANLSLKDLWAGDLLDNECVKVYKDWKNRNQKLTYLFETEVADLLRKRSINKVLEVKNGQHPILLKEFLGKKISLETMCILDEIIGYTNDWERLISENLVYPDIQNKINKYKSFVSVDIKKYKEVLIELCQ